jgi:hypothetical protein
MVHDGDDTHGFVNANWTVVDQGIEKCDFEVVSPWRPRNVKHHVSCLVVGDVDGAPEISISLGMNWTGANQWNSGTDFADQKRTSI